MTVTEAVTASGITPSADYKGIEEAYRKLGLRSQINTILKPALERSLQRGTHW